MTGVFEVAICGPNLRDQSKGSFHVHASDCGDVSKYGGEYEGGGYKKYGGEDPWHTTVKSREEAVMFIYDPGDFEYDPETEIDSGGYYDDFWFAPCCRMIPRKESE